MKIKAVLISIGLLLTTQVARAAVEAPTEQKLIAKGGEVEILAIGKPSFIKIHGKGSSATGHLEIKGDKVSGEFAFDLSSLDTGIETRNEHMKKKYLEVGKYPQAILAIQSVASIVGWSLAKPKLSETEFVGSLSMHGAKHDVKGKFSVNSSGEVEAQFTVALSDFKVDIPQFAGITVANDVQVTVKIAKLEKP